MAQLVEQLIRNQQVAGSSPASSSMQSSEWEFGALALATARIAEITWRDCAFGEQSLLRRFAPYKSGQ